MSEAEATRTTQAGKFAQPDAQFNPYLEVYRARRPDSSAGAEGKFESAERELVQWQTRAGPPSGYELMLATALEEIFSRNVDQLPDIVAALNRAGVLAPNAGPWNEELFQKTMRELGELIVE